MMYDSKQLETEGALEIARLAAVAARTAPKARGTDDILTLALTGEDKDRVADEIGRIGEEKNIAFFIRDAKNVRSAAAVLVVGVRNKQRGVPNCGFCGYPDCGANKAANGVCAMCTMDLGIALGSAAAVLADHRVDNRMMFTIGKAALSLGLLPEAHSAYGLPLSVAGKNPFFDRG
jgi:uncharacterized ferredoxin-like protein